MPKRVMLILGLLLGLTLWPKAASAHEVCFPEDQSPHCLSDPFSDYWEANGGLPVFGYPITTVNREQNRETGKVYRTQWMERNRFELHPENTGTPYEVLLGLLGKDRLAQLGRQPDPAESGPKAGCLWFKETGHNVCDQGSSIGFKSYWQANGLKIDGLDNYARSLQLFGLPLTEPQMERNSSGDLVETQWFERARFEWHPNNPNNFKVLLGLLGKEVRGTTPPTAPPTTSPPTTANCTMNAPTVAEGAQAWVVYPEIASNATQTVCVRLTISAKPKSGATATVEIDLASGTQSLIGLTDSSGVATIQFKVGSQSSGRRNDVRASFSTGQTATTSFVIK